MSERPGPAIAPRDSSAIRCGDHYRQRVEPMEMPTVAAARRRGEAQPGETLEQDRQGNLHLKPGKWRPDAKMNAGAEGDVRQERPRRIETIGVDIALWVAVGGAEEQPDLLALAELDPGHLRRPA